MGRQARTVVNRNLSQLEFKGLVGQVNNTEKGVPDKIAVEFNKHVNIKLTGEQCVRKYNRQTSRAHKSLDISHGNGAVHRR